VILARIDEVERREEAAGGRDRDLGERERTVAAREAAAETEARKLGQERDRLAALRDELSERDKALTTAEQNLAERHARLRELIGAPLRRYRMVGLLDLYGDAFTPDQRDGRSGYAALLASAATIAGGRQARRSAMPSLAVMSAAGVEGCAPGSDTERRHHARTVPQGLRLNCRGNSLVGAATRTARLTRIASDPGADLSAAQRLRLRVARIAAAMRERAPY
jgi:hypothetical protein